MTTDSKRNSALEIATSIRGKILDDKTLVSSLLISCKTICSYLETLSQNSWIEEELNGYDLGKFRNYAEQEKLLPNYRRVVCIYYDVFNRPLLFPNYKTMERLSAIKIPNAVTELETVHTLVITGGPMLEVINELNKQSGHRVVKAVVSDNYMHAVIAGIRIRISEFLDNVIQDIQFGGVIEMNLRRTKERSGF